jgi:hypothetical protein
MDYEIFTLENDGEKTEHVVIFYKDGSGESFSVDQNNPRYLQFLEQLEVESS